MSSDPAGLLAGSAPPELTDEETGSWQSAWQRWLGAEVPPDASNDPRDAPRLRLLAKSANGLELDADEAALLRHWEHSEAAYRRYLGELASVAPGCIVLKGLSLARLYPSGWIRASGDLDLYAPTSTDLWAACRLLDEQGWDLDVVIAVKVDDEPRLVVSFTSLCPECGGKFEVSIFELGHLGHPLQADPRRHLPVPSEAPELAQLVPLLWERVERPFTLRDVFDVGLVCGVHPERVDLAWQVVDAVGLWPEYQQLLDTGRRYDVPVPPAPDDLDDRVRAARRARRQRRRSRSFRRATLAYLAGRRLVGRRESRWRAAGSQAVRRLCPPATVYAAGLPVCGAQLDSDPAPLAFRSWDGRLAADTPLGRIEFTHVPDLSVGASASSSPGSPLQVEPSAQGGERR